MKSAKDFLESEVERHVRAARDITRRAEDLGEPMSDSDRAQVEDHVAQATALKARVAELQDGEDMKERLDALSEAGIKAAPSEAPAARTIGDAFVQSEAYQALKARGLAGRWTTGPIELAKAFKGGFKTVGDDIVDEASADNELLGAPQIIPGYQEVITGVHPYVLTVADLFSQGTASTNSIVFLRESLIDDDAYVVAEKASKPTSYIEFDKTTVPVEKLATLLQVSDEMLEDAPAVASYINSRLALFVKRAEEAYLLTKLDDNVSATAAAGDLTGGTTRFDAIFAGIVDVRTNGGLEPDAVILHPIDHAEMTISKDAVNGQYFSGGPYVAPAQNPWGLRAVVTQAQTQNTGIVGAFREGAQVWRRGGLTVEATNSHGTNFALNVTAIRAEERLALTVYRPAAFSYVTSL